MSKPGAGEAWRRLRRVASGHVINDDWWTLSSGPRHLSASLYCTYAALGLALTVGQFFTLPRGLGAEAFGTVAIGISLTQGLFSFGDLGIGRMADDTSRPRAERNHLRTLSYTAASITLTGMALVAVAISFVGYPVLAGSCLLGAAAAWTLYPLQLRAQASEGYGDEVGAARQHFLWQNAPKLGLISGAFITGHAVGTMLGGLLAAVVVLPPKLPALRMVREIISEWRAWSPVLVSVAAPFILAWSDTYFVAIGHGVTTVAGYVLVYRILSVVSYFYLPFSSVLLSRLNRNDTRAPWSVTALSLAITLPTLVLLAVGLVRFGPAIFPDIPFNFGILAPLLLTNVCSNISHLAGTTLAAYGAFTRIIVANLAGAIVAVAGHLLFTLDGPVIMAAIVSLAGMATSALLQSIAAWRATTQARVRSPS